MLKTYYRSFGILLSILVMFNIVTLSQTLNALDQSREETLTQLRELRDKLNSYAQENEIDTLINQMSDVIDYSKITKDTAELKKISLYFKSAKSQLDQKDKHAVASILNRDIYLKLNCNTDTVLHLHTKTTFGRTCDIQVQAFINGLRQSSGSYRLYWLTFLGEDLTKMISAKKSEGSSNLFTNPYNLSIVLPGFITFWLEDTSNGILYKPDFLYKELYTTDKSLDINFIKLK